MGSPYEPDQTGDHSEDRCYSLKEVAERTGFSQRRLTLDCRAGRIEHTHYGQFRGMTFRQIAVLVGQHAEVSEVARLSPIIPNNESPLRQALRMSRKNAMRATPRRRTA